MPEYQIKNNMIEEVNLMSTNERKITLQNFEKHVKTIIEENNHKNKNLTNHHKKSGTSHNDDQPENKNNIITTQHGRLNSAVFFL